MKKKERTDYWHKKRSSWENISYIWLIYIENKCDYHQNHFLNTSVPDEQKLDGMLDFIMMSSWLYCNMNFFLYLIIGTIRTMVSFSIIHILLAIITFICGLYSIRDYRYTYKRLTGMIYILSGNNDCNYMKIVR